MSNKLALKIAQRIPIKPYLIKATEGMISFTFDDILHSAATRGSEILLQRGFAGTYYVSGGLTDQIENGQQCHSRSDLLALAHAGHELGAHTFTHVSVPGLSRSAFFQQAEDSSAFIASIDPGIRVSSFSYPFGDCDIKAKRWAAKRYACSRGVAQGLNQGWVDLAQLKAIPLQCGRIDEAGIRSAIDLALQRKAWLIFYTHDISEHPSAFGCTPALLQYAVDYAHQVSARVLPVKNALGAIAYR